MEPAEGSRDTINHELRKREREAGQRGHGEAAPGDEAAPGTPGTGVNICPDCEGTGRLESAPCPTCNGTGRIVEGIGGA